MALNNSKTHKLSPMIESSLIPNPDHEVRGAYQLENDKSSHSAVAAPSEAELAHSQTGSDGGSIRLNLPPQTALND